MKDYVIADWTMWLAGDMLQRGISVFSAPESDTLARLSHEFDRKTQLQVQDSLPGMSNNGKWKMDRGAFCRFMLDARDFLNEAQSAAVPMHVEEDLLRGIAAAGIFSSGGEDHDIAFRFAHCFVFRHSSTSIDSFRPRLMPSNFWIRK